MLADALPEALTFTIVGCLCDRRNYMLEDALREALTFTLPCTFQSAPLLNASAIDEFNWDKEGDDTAMINFQYWKCEQAYESIMVLSDHDGFQSPDKGWG